MSQNIYVVGKGDEKEVKEQLGPVGRAFLNRMPESTPDVKYYSLQEFPLRDHARLARITELTALPVFQVHDLKNCVGVLELAGSSLSDVEICEQRLKAVGLTSYPWRQFHPGPEVQQDRLEEIKQAVRVVSDNYPLALALVFIPSKSCGDDECCHSCSYLGLLKLAIRRESFGSSFEFENFVQAHGVFNLQEGKGVAGKALASRKSYFCRNINAFSIAEYPFVHYARASGLNLSFAICLQVGQSENDHLILEFFLLPGNYSHKYTHSLLESLLAKLKQQFQSCRIIIEDLPGEEVISKVMNSLEDDEIDYLPVIENSTLPPQLQIWPCDEEYDSESNEGDNEIYSESEFLEYVKPAELSCSSPDEEEYGFVFWWDENLETQALESLDRTSFNNCSISGKIKRVLHRLPGKMIEFGLAQFWSPKTRENIRFLTIDNQPFALSNLRKDYASYWKHCMNLNIYTFEEKHKEQLGPVGRAFCNQQPESSPNVRYYTLKEFPQRDVARLCGIQNLAAVPVFEARGQICIGVLEFLDLDLDLFLDSDFGFYEQLAEVLSEVGLTLNYCYGQPDTEGEQDSWKEIKQLFGVVNETYPLQEALAFVPLRSCVNDEWCQNSSDLGFLRLAFYKSDFYNSLMAFHRCFYLQNGKGVSGKAFASQKSLFCKSLSDLSITEYPFVHHARNLGLTLSFAIFLQNTQSDNDPLVLEFFLWPGNYSYEHIYALLGSLLTTVKQHLQSFSIASEDIQEAFPQVIISSNGEEVDRLRIIQNCEHPYPPDFVDQQIMLDGNSTNSRMHVVNVEGDVFETRAKSKVTARKSKRQGKGKKLDISYDDLKQHFGKSLDKAASSLGVSRSTMKRSCRAYVIRWPFHEKNKSNYFPFQMKRTNAPPQESEGSTSSLHETNPPCLNQSVGENVDTIVQVAPDGAMPMTRDARTVTIKASYGELPMIKFLLSFSSKLVELEEEVAKRLKLKVGNFSMMYYDEDNDPISITCDSDLQLCIETVTSSDKSAIKMSILFDSN